MAGGKDCTWLFRDAYKHASFEQVRVGVTPKLCEQDSCVKVAEDSGLSYFRYSTREEEALQV